MELSEAFAMFTGYFLFIVVLVAVAQGGARIIMFILEPILNFVNKLLK